MTTGSFVLFGDDKYGELQSVLFVSLIECHYFLGVDVVIILRFARMWHVDI